MPSEGCIEAVGLIVFFLYATMWSLVFSYHVWSLDCMVVLSSVAFLITSLVEDRGELLASRLALPYNCECTFSFFHLVDVYRNPKLNLDLLT